MKLCLTRWKRLQMEWRSWKLRMGKRRRWHSHVWPRPRREGWEGPTLNPGASKRSNSGHFLFLKGALTKGNFWSDFIVQDKKVAQEKERENRIAEAEVQNLQGARHQEGLALAQKLAQKQLQIKEISSDGHCMYRTIADQLAQRSKVGVFLRADSLLFSSQCLFYRRDSRRSPSFPLFDGSLVQPWASRSCVPRQPSAWEAALMTSCPSSQTPTLVTCTQQVHSHVLLSFTRDFVGKNKLGNISSRLWWFCLAADLQTSLRNTAATLSTRQRGGASWR